MFKEETAIDETGIDPFDKALTIASYSMQVYCTNFLQKDTIAIFSRARQLKQKQSHEALQWLSYTAEKEDICIQHVRNGGEKRIGKYSLDGYCQETNTAYEYQGCYWHGKRLWDVTKYGERNMNVFFFFNRMSGMLQEERYREFRKWQNDGSTL